MQQQINFQEMESRMDRIEQFVLEVLKEKNPEGYAKFMQEEKEGEKLNSIQEKN